MNYLHQVLEMTINSIYPYKSQDGIMNIMSTIKSYKLIGNHQGSVWISEKTSFRKIS